MNQHLIAEYVSPGHPDRLADAIVERLVDLAVARDAEALVGLECAVHTNHVFVDGRIAAGRSRKDVLTDDDVRAAVRETYRAAGYDAAWRPSPDELTILTNVCYEDLGNEERGIRDLSDDQNVVVGYACKRPETDYLPPAHFVANVLGRALWAWRKTASDKFGPDFKVLVDLSEENGRFVWNRLTLNVQHKSGVFATEQHVRVMPVVREALAKLEARGVRGVADLPQERVVLNGLGDFILGGPEGDNGLSGKKLVVDFYGPGVPIGGGAICGKDPHKVDVAGAFRARELALKLVKERGDAAVMVRLGWTPGDAAPAFREAVGIDSLGLAHPIPAAALPPEEWFSIHSIVADLKLTQLNRASRVLSGYFFSSSEGKR